MQQEFDYKGTTLSGFPPLILLVLFLLGAIGVVASAFAFPGFLPLSEPLSIAIAVVLVVLVILLGAGLMSIEPGEARVCVLFGEYRGTFKRTGFYWVNPFVLAKTVTLRARNLEVPPIKVNDKQGNPVMIGLVLVWRLNDTYKALFEVDAQTMASAKTDEKEASTTVGSVMQALDHFVRVQSDAALREVATIFAYDHDETDATALTLRSGGDDINNLLEAKLNERVHMAGIEVIEARLNYLAYAPEIAAVMLRRQQASAILAAREKIVEGAVTKVKMALDRIDEEQIVQLDEERKAAMVSNLLVVLCGEENAQPVVNTGMLHH